MIYVLLGNQTVSTISGLTIGSTTLMDKYNNEVGYTYLFDTTTENRLTNESEATIGKKVYYWKSSDHSDKTEYEITAVSSGLCSITTNKHSGNIHVLGNITSTYTKQEGINNSVPPIMVRVPAASKIIFDGVTLNGQFYLGHGIEKNMKNLNSITFNNSTINGQLWNIVMNKLNDLKFINTTFNEYLNGNNSNPIWNQGNSTTNYTFEGCTINSVRPIKLLDGRTNTGDITFKNNIFNMKEYLTKDGDKYKDVGIYIDGDSKNVINGNVTITGNTLKAGTALVAFADDSYTMAANKTFTISDNKDSEGTALSEDKLIVKWKSANKIDAPSSN